MAIKRRDFLQGMGASVLMGSAAAALASSHSDGAAAESAAMPILPAGSRPNILLLQVDQMQWGAINDRTVCHTPNLNRFAKEGLLFERSYTASAICGPSRTMMNTGAYHWHNGIFNQAHSATAVTVDPFPNVVMFSQQLKSVGYRTGFVGKWDVSMVRPPADFGYDELAGMHLPKWEKSNKEIDTNPDNVPRPIHPFSRDGAGASNVKTFQWPGMTEPFIMWGNFDYPVEEGNAYFLAESGIRMMKRFAAKNQPWHMQIQFNEPHDPYLPLKKYLDQYNPNDIPVAKSFHDTFQGKPGLHRREAGIWGHCTEDDYRQGRAHYYAFCTEIDEQLGRILKTLDETGQRDNTLVAFTTDHGDMCGAHHMWSKDWMPYEETYRVPLILRWPKRIKPGISTSKLAHVHDLAHTFVDAAAAPKMPYAEGRSLLPLADDPNTADWPDHILNVWYGGEFVRGLHMAVTDRYKYMFNSFDFDELYDLHEDPDELYNRVDDKSYAAVTDDMRARLYELMADTGDPYGGNKPSKFNVGEPFEHRAMPERYASPQYLPRGKRMHAT